MTGADPEELSLELKALVKGGLVRHRDGVLTGWSLTEAGRALYGEHVATGSDGVSNGPLVDLYDHFVPLNTRFLAACNDWQLRLVDGTPVPNDHCDHLHDAKVLAELQSIHAAIAGSCRNAATRYGRYGRYGDRLELAIRRVAAGEPDWFTSPRIDSYLTVWFELHEDLLLSLGIPRSTH